MTNAVRTIIIQNAMAIIMLSMLLADSLQAHGYGLIPYLMMAVSQIVVIVNCWRAA